jgi:hypothetical protein
LDPVGLASEAYSPDESLANHKLDPYDDDETEEPQE